MRSPGRARAPALLTQVKPHLQVAKSNLVQGQPTRPDPGLCSEPPTRWEPPTRLFIQIDGRQGRSRHAREHTFGYLKKSWKRQPSDSCRTRSLPQQAQGSSKTGSAVQLDA